MKLSLNWLNEFIDLSDVNPHELGDLLTMKTCEVEGLTPFFEYLDHFTVAQVNKVTKHPDADKLSVCEVFTGRETIQIVTGAPNVAAGKKYPLAPVGSTLPNGTQLKKAKLRGLDSFGMLCSIKELELDNFQWGGDVSPEAGLLTLPESFTVGNSLRTEMGLVDTIIDIDNKSITHRSDLWSHFGFARELSALLKRPLKKDVYTYELPPADHQQSVNVTIKENSAAAYCGLVITNVNNTTLTPLSIQAKLVAGGMRSINFFVDLSNYVMLEMGQPSHAFDRQKLKSDVVIDRSKKGEKLTLLDGRNLSLPTSLVVVRDGDEPIALAGVMGGASTEVSGATHELFLESATFFRPDIRKTVAQTGIRSEASYRFEKGQTPVQAPVAVARFVALLKEQQPQVQIGPMVTQQTEPTRTNTIATTSTYIRQRLGLSELSDSKIDDILQTLGMKVARNGDDISVTVPHYRSYHDVTLPEDLVEELGRVIGYRNIKPIPFMVRCEVPQYQNQTRKLEHHLRQLLAYRYHYTEVYNYAFHSSGDVAADTRYALSAIEMANPIMAEQPFLRISPLLGLLHNIESVYKKYRELRFFEIERIFIPKTDSLPQERLFLAGIELSEDPCDDVLNQMLSAMSDLLNQCGLPKTVITNEQLHEQVFHPGRGIALKHNEKVILKLGQVHPKITDALGVSRPVHYFEAFVDDLLPTFLAPLGEYIPPSRYPTSDFELTVVADHETPFAEIAKAAGQPKRATKDEDLTFIESLEHVRTYKGQQIPEGKKAVTLRLVWCNRARTLTGSEIKDLQERLIKRLSVAGFELRV